VSRAYELRSKDLPSNNLTSLDPPTPMCRLDVDALLRSSVDPFIAVLLAWECQGVNFMTVHDADLKVGIGWRIGNW
jgi:hypothetical protein